MTNDEEWEDLKDKCMNDFLWAAEEIERLRGKVADLEPDALFLRSIQARSLQLLEEMDEDGR